MNTNKKELIKQYLGVMGGSLIFALSVNLFVVPFSLYSPGIIGIAQIIRTLIAPYLPFTFDIAGIINFLLNIPLFILAFHSISRHFFAKTILSILTQAIAMSIIPIPTTPLISNILTSCIIGGLISGFGVGYALRQSGCCGGTDIIGFYLAKKNAPFSVGQVSIIINIFVFGLCAILFNLETAIYSIIYMVVMYNTCDKTHYQNINMTAMVFTKNQDVKQEIINQIGRGVTYWQGAGAYTDENTYILVSAINKYEEPRFRKLVYSLDPHAFVIFQEGMSINGNFEKRL